MICAVDAPHTGHIYFIDLGEGITKIGYSDNARARFAQHRSDYGEDVRFLFCVPGSMPRERAFHSYLEPYRMGRFVDTSPTPDRVMFVKRLRAIPEHFYIPDDILANIQSELAQENGYSANLPKASKVKASFFLTEEMHEDLTETCKEHKISQQQFFEAAYDLYMRALGKPGLEKSE